MSVEVNKAVVRRMNFEFIQARKPEVASEILADTFINHTPVPGLPEGKKGVFTFFGIMWNAFPDMTVEILDQVAEGDMVTTRKAFHGTHQGDFMGIPATNKRVQINVIDIIRLEDSRFVEHWAIMDQMALMQQLGAIPRP
jgi:predicted ester cyclase